MSYFLRGKLKINENIKRNFADKARFFCEFAEYSANIPINKIMKMDKQSLNLMGKLGRKNVEKKYNVDQMCQTTFTEYKKLLK